uniref:Integrin subunit alpha 7 n=1 Tax=Ornithorhynchus anatinus TaxID=9258 RepID=A0A6I8PIP9_ORNAN
MAWVQGSPRSVPRPLLRAFLCALLLPGIGTFNLDVGAALRKDGDPDSLFVTGRNLPGRAANRTGGLYACPLTSAMEDCFRVDIDQGADVQRESKENQWLGVTVRSQGPGGKIVTCAHLYEARQRVAQPLETRDVIGRCFVLSDDLRVRDELDGGDWRFCEGRPQGHDQFGFCQQGAAAAFSPDRHYLLFGAPGTYNWKGTARAELCDQGPLDLARLDDGPYEAGGEKEQDPRLIPVPANSYLGLLFVTSVDSSDPDQLVYKSLDPAAGDLALNSYLGFSIDAGRGLTRLEELSFVAGAPRANHTGAVVILRRDSASRLVPEAVLAGERLTSGFGYALAVLDLNGDGWTDLVVGAPHFFERQEELGGAVYIYLNSGGRWAGVSPLRLNGSAGSMFGVSVAALGDVNLDGFPDIAVGAPFDGAGKVFVYHGSSLGVVTKPAQVLEGEAVGITTFGYSLSGGLDVDGNDYPDLLVGSLADTVALFRARPVLHVTHNISLSPLAIDLEVPSCADGHGVCVDIRVCFSYVAAPATYSPSIALDFRFDGDTERRKRGQVPRVAFLSRQEDEPRHQASGTVWLQDQQDGDCGDATFRLQDNVKDKLRPIVVTMTYGLRGCGDDKICQSNLQLVHARFCDRVGDTEFQPLPMDEEDEGTAVFAMSGQADLALEITVTNFPSDPSRPQADGDAAHEAQLLVTFPDTLRYAGVRAAPVSAEKSPLCLSNENASRVECELGNPMGRGAQVSFYLILSTGGITIETTMLEVELLLATISEQELQPVTARARVVIELPLSITGVAIPQQLFFSGEVRGESAMRSERDVGSAVRYEVTVSNRGRSLNTLGSAFVHLRWPHEIANGKWLLYPMRVELEGGGGGGPGRRGDCGVLTNPLRLGRRQRRELGRAELDPQPARSGSRWLVAAAEKKRNVTLDCALGTASCMDIQCPLSSFDRAAVLRVWGRLWNSTFLEVRRACVGTRGWYRVGTSRASLVPAPSLPVPLPAGVVRQKKEGRPLTSVLSGLTGPSPAAQVGFFKRARRRPEATVPQYHAVKIPREDRQLFKEEKTGTIQRKDWSTNWGEGTDGHLAPGTA